MPKLHNKKSLIQILQRGGIPFAIMGAISALLYLQGEPADARELLIVAVMLFSIGAATLIYDIDSWLVAKKIAAHFGVMCATVYPCLLISGWFPLDNVLDALAVFGYFVTVGVAILAGFGVYYLVRRQLSMHKDKVISKEDTAEK